MPAAHALAVNDIGRILVLAPLVAVGAHGEALGEEDESGKINRGAHDNVGILVNRVSLQQSYRQQLRHPHWIGQHSDRPT